MGAILLSHHRPAPPNTPPILLRSLSLKKRDTTTVEDRARVFPAEIEDMVIDNLNNDRVALANCSLVCKSWSPRSRFHLFNTLTLKLSRTNGGEKATQFSVLSDMSPYVGDNLRNLHLAGDVSPIPITYIREDAVAGVLKRLPWLETLTMHSFQLASTNCVPVKSCTISGLDIFQVISNISGLRTLRLRDFSCGEREDDTSARYLERATTSLPGHQNKTRLEKLELQNVSIPQYRFSSFLHDVFVRGAARVASRVATNKNGLRHLVFPLEHRGFRGRNAIDNFDICGRLIRYVGSSLEHLVLDLWGIQGMAEAELVFESQRNICKSLNLVSCTTLRTLELWIPAHLGYNRDDQPWLAATEILAHLSRAALALGNLKIVVIDPMEMDAPMWNEVPDALTRFDRALCRLVQIKRVNFCSPGFKVGSRWSSCSSLFLSMIDSFFPESIMQGIFAMHIENC